MKFDGVYVILRLQEFGSRKKIGTLRKGKKTVRLTIRLGEDTYSHFRQSAKQGGYRSVPAVISRLCDIVALRGRVSASPRSADMHNEINTMFEYYSRGGDPDV